MGRLHNSNVCVVDIQIKLIFYTTSLYAACHVTISVYLNYVCGNAFVGGVMI